MFHDLKSEAKLIATATVGGLASVAGGGKFGNGAVTAAFGYLYNEACGGGNCYGEIQRQWEQVTNAVVVGFQDAIAELGEYYGYAGAALGGGGVARTAARVAIRYAAEQSYGLPPEGTYPPGVNPRDLMVGPASRPGAPGKSLYDRTGGEWRFQSGDKWHNPHWDHNSWKSWNSPWENVPIGGKSPVK